MSLSYIDNQPVKFISGNYIGHNDRDCHNDHMEFCQYVERLDTTVYQVNINSNSSELVTAGDFSTACGVDWTCGANWAIAAGVAVHTAGVGGNLTQPVCIMNDRYYRVRFDIDAITGTLNVTLGGNSLGVFTTTGAKEVFILLAAISNVQIQFIPGTDSVTIDDVSIVEFCQAGYEIETTTGTSIFTDVTSASTIRFERKAQVTVDWTQAPIDDCYVICSHQADLTREMICNGDFFEDALWTLGAWSIAGGVASFPAGPPFAPSLNQTLLHPLLGGRCYTITFDITNYAGAPPAGIDIRAVDTGILIGSVDSNGAKSFPIDLTSFGNETQIEFINNAAAVTLDLDNVSITMDTICFEEDACSECYGLVDDWDDLNICTTMLRWTNSDDAFGFDYTNFSFTQNFRHPFFLWKPRYTLDSLDHEDSGGTIQVLRRKSVKISQLDLDVMPEYLHDALRLGIAHDTFTIDTVGFYAMPEDYEPDWQLDTETAKIIIPVRRVTTNLVNENC